jgi:hypothetical protein
MMPGSQPVPKPANSYDPNSEYDENGNWINPEAYDDPWGLEHYQQTHQYGTEDTGPGTRTIGQDGNSLYAVARNKLGPDASEAEVVDYTKRIMSANPNLGDPRTLQSGTVVNLPDSNTQVTAASEAAYNKSDAEYQTYRAEQAAAAQAAAAAMATAGPVAAQGSYADYTDIGMGGTGFADSGPSGLATINQALHDGKAWVQDGLAKLGGWGLRQNSLVGDAVFYGAGALSVVDEIVQPSNLIEAGLLAAGPAIGKIAGEGISLLNKVPGLGYDVGNAATTALRSMGQTASDMTGRMLDELGLMPAVVENTGIRGVANSADSARGLSKLGGIFSSTTNEAGGTVWTSAGKISQNDFAGIVNGELMQGKNVNIISGVHGDVNGTIAAIDRQMYLDDVVTFGEIPGVTVHHYPDLTSQRISELLTGTDTTIGGFCNSGVCLAPHW